MPTILRQRVDGVAARKRDKRDTDPAGRHGRPPHRSPDAGSESFAAMLTDQALNDGAEARLFGLRDDAQAPPWAFAVRYNIPVVPACIERVGGAHFRITVYNPITAKPGADPLRGIRFASRRRSTISLRRAFAPARMNGSGCTTAGRSSPGSASSSRRHTGRRHARIGGRRGEPSSRQAAWRRP